MTTTTINLVAQTPAVWATTPPQTKLNQHSAVGQALHRAGNHTYPHWLTHIRAASACTRPIQLFGTITTTDPHTGQQLSQKSTSDLPDAVIYTPCGNRRASVCPACSRTYQHDAYHLIKAGLTGGKNIPETVATHPAVFATFTAPSFGPVHTRVIRKHTCTNRTHCQCRPEPCHPRRASPGTCEHGNHTTCYTRHDADDPLLGKPLCLDCYDHDHQVVWNTFAGELCQRFLKIDPVRSPEN